MKRQIWLLVALVGATGSYYLVSKERFSSMTTERKTLSIALQGDIEEGPLSPENISSIPLFHLHYNLWDTLITEKKGSAIADSFTISQDGKVYNFQISPAASFSNGRPITAADVKASIERLRARGENGHINAKSTIKAITATGDLGLEVELFEPTSSFLYLLSTPELGIVPREALDEKGNVVDLSVTSGAYVLAEIDFPGQKALLQKNPYFRRFGENAPEKVRLHFLMSGNLAAFTDILASKNYDLIELQNSDADSFIPAIKTAGYKYEVTLPSISIFLMPNSKRIDTATAQAFASVFREHFHFGVENGAERPSHQFLPPQAFGSLAASEIPNIPAKATPKLPAEVRVKVVRKTGALYDEIRRVFSVAGTKVEFLDWGSPEEYDFRLIGHGLNTEYPEIGLHLQVLSPYALFDVSKQVKDLVRAATHALDDRSRSNVIKEIGRELLQTGKIIPLTLRSYVHVSNPDRVDASQIFGYDGNIPLYELRELK